MTERLARPLDAAAIAVFRMAFGAIVAVSAVRFLAYGWVGTLFVSPRFHFHYYGFGWLPELSAAATYALFAALILLGVLVAIGALYRFAIAALFLVFTFVQLQDVSNYLNHYYLVSVLALLLCFIPAGAYWSVDAWRNPARARPTLPAWCTYLLRFQVATVYVFAGLAKLNSDWLLHAQPLSIWLSARTDFPVIGPLFTERWVHVAAAWFGFLFDATVPFWLMARRTRPLAYVALLFFHAMTLALFPIGMFPVIMTTAALVFFDPSWPRKLLRRAAKPAPAEGTPLRRWAFALFAAFAVVQLAAPLRAHLYGGNVSWHEQGMRFSWRVMTREKNGSVTFIVRNAQGRERHVTPSRYLSSVQEREMSVQPDLILQLAHRIVQDYAAKGEKVTVTADAFVSLNGRPMQRFIDPAVDLATVEDGLSQASWVLPEPDGEPALLVTR